MIMEENKDYPVIQILSEKIENATGKRNKKGATIMAPRITSNKKILASFVEFLKGGGGMKNRIDFI